MVLFNHAEPILRWKQDALDVQDRCGLLRLHWRWGDRTLVQTHFTRIDQVFLLWGAITACIFLTAQFLPLSWTIQVALWSALTLLGTVAMANLAWFWVRVERLCWLVYLWGALMAGGVLITGYGVLHGVGWILLNLCPLWLGLCAIGYGTMGLGLESRSFLGAGLVHAAAVPVLVPSYQFLLAGLVMSGSLLLLACLQWDMRAPVKPDLLSAAEVAFNHQQQLLRQT